MLLTFAGDMHRIVIGFHLKSRAKKKHFHSVNECTSNKASSLILHIFCPTDYFSLGYSLKGSTEEKDGACIQL